MSNKFKVDTILKYLSGIFFHSEPCKHPWFVTHGLIIHIARFRVLSYNEIFFL